MPYIKPEERPKMDEIVELMMMLDVKANGDLNYILFKYCQESCLKNYNSIKNFIAELEECAHEIRRRILAPYEDEKIEEHGDIE